MLTFQWNALRVGDHVSVHDDLDPGLGLHDGIVAIVESQRGGSSVVGIRDCATGVVRRPRRHAVHLCPIDARQECWRCASIASPRG